jgi:hypothetical protein
MQGDQFLAGQAGGRAGSSEFLKLGVTAALT